MPASACRVCGNSFFAGPLLQFERMPKAAQHLPDAKELSADRGVNLVLCQCAGCGLAQLSNDPVPYYREVIRAAAFSPEMIAFRSQQIGELVRRFGLDGKKAIEIGCGRGEFLSILKRCGLDAYGLEYAAESVAHCARQGLQAIQGFLDDPAATLPHAPFDTFFILNVLEHLPDPNATLRAIANNLTDVAIGLVEVPNFDMIIRQNLFSEFIGDHLFYFTRETLERTLQLNGFDILDCRVVWHDYIVSAVVTKRRRLDLTTFHARQADLRREVDGFLHRCGNKRVAVWGAGHQALAILALFGLAPRICYVVDSAPFKQGRYTPATHLPIVAPDALESDPVEAVIIMAASYSDEIARILRQKFGHRLLVAIIRETHLEIVQIPSLAAE